MAQECTPALALACAVTVQATIRSCAAAAASQGANIIADIKCAKNLLANKKYCLPCVCS